MFNLPYPWHFVDRICMAAKTLTETRHRWERKVLFRLFEEIFF